MASNEPTGEKKKRAVRVGRLKTCGEVAAEIEKVYRRSVREAIDSQTAARQVRMLSALREALVDSQVERRLEELLDRVNMREDGAFTGPDKLHA